MLLPNNSKRQSGCNRHWQTQLDVYLAHPACNMRDILPPHFVVHPSTQQHRTGLQRSHTVCEKCALDKMHLCVYGKCALEIVTEEMHLCIDIVQNTCTLYCLCLPLPFLTSPLLARIWISVGGQSSRVHRRGSNSTSSRMHRRGSSSSSSRVHQRSSNSNSSRVS